MPSLLVELVYNSWLGLMPLLIGPVTFQPSENIGNRFFFIKMDPLELMLAMHAGSSAL